MKVLQVLAHPIRQRIVELLADGERTAGEIAAQFSVSRPAISQHLGAMQEGGLVRMRRQGQRRLYSLDPEPLAELDAWLSRYRVFWSQRLDALDAQLHKVEDDERG